jgi:hypothetical protein
MRTAVAAWAIWAEWVEWECNPLLYSDSLSLSGERGGERAIPKTPSIERSAGFSFSGVFLLSRSPRAGWGHPYRIDDAILRLYVRHRRSRSRRYRSQSDR